ncbi:MAG TPA: hypothetical protein VGK58_01525, partial [Lacipirellulaceae bacterium]
MRVHAQLRQSPARESAVRVGRFNMNEFNALFVRRNRRFPIRFDLSPLYTFSPSRSTSWTLTMFE